MIKGWTDVPPRLPRLGSIALGVKDEKGYPRAVDYFVVPPEVQAVYGPQPRELDIAFPVDDFDRIATAWLKRYGDQFGLICRGDGETATVAANYGMLREEYGVLAAPEGHCLADTGEVLATEVRGEKTWVKIPCRYHHCQFYQQKKCREVCILSVLLPKVPGVTGVYSLDTGSINSYQNIRGAVSILKEMTGGRIALIPLKLRVRMEEKHPMLGDGRQIKRRVPILYVDMGSLTLLDVLRIARERQLLMSVPVLPVAPVELEPPDEEKKPELLFGPFPPDGDTDAVGDVGQNEAGETSATGTAPCGEDPDRFRKAVFARLREWAEREGLGWEPVDTIFKRLVRHKYGVASRSELSPDDWQALSLPHKLNELCGKIAQALRGALLVVVKQGPIEGKNGLIWALAEESGGEIYLTGNALEKAFPGQKILIWGREGKSPQGKRVFQVRSLEEVA